MEECVFSIGSDNAITHPTALHLIKSTGDVRVVCSSDQYKKLSFEYNTKPTSYGTCA